jgi:transcriptional regulator with XRE-family HTH domain
MSKRGIRKFDPLDVYAGQRVKKIRKLAGLSQDQLGKQLRIPRSAQQIRKYEVGEDRMTVGTLYQIAFVFNKPIEYFVEGFGQEKEKINYNLSYTSEDLNLYTFKS